VTLAAWVSLPDVMNFENPENPPAAKFTARLLEADNPSLIVVRLVLNGPFLDALSVGSHRSFNYTDGHARLLALLRESASLAPSNCLRYREGLKL
jgi:hypothetical protein